MIISHHLKFIFIHIQRTGGSSIISSLKNELENDLEIVSQHGNAKADPKDLLIKYHYYFKFGFVRNPWDRIFSWYSLLQKGNPVSIEEEKNRFEYFLLNEFIEDEKNDPYFHFNQLDYFKNNEGKLVIQRIGRFENYHHDFKNICENIGLPNIQIVKHNATSPKNYRDFYTSNTKGFISEKCKEDIEYFSYSF